MPHGWAVLRYTNVPESVIFWHWFCFGCFSISWPHFFDYLDFYVTIPCNSDYLCVRCSHLTRRDGLVVTWKDKISKIPRRYMQDVWWDRKQYVKRALDSCALESCTGLLGSSSVRLAKTRQRMFCVWLRAEMRPHRRSRAESESSLTGFAESGHLCATCIGFVSRLRRLRSAACGGNSIPMFRDS